MTQLCSTTGDGVVLWSCRRHIKRIQDTFVIPGAAQALASLSRAGYKIVLMKNQPGISSGLLSNGQVNRVNDSQASSPGRAESLT